MAKPKKGVVPPQLRKYLFKKGGKSPGKKTGGRSTAKGKKNANGGRKQGLVSWVTNVAALGIGMSDLVIRAGEAMRQPAGYKLNYFTRSMISDYTGVSLDAAFVYQGFAAKNLVRGYAPIAGAIGFKMGMGMIQKRVKIKSIIPRLSA